MVNWRMLSATRTASVARMLSVMVMLSMPLDAILATAPPDSTPWVT